MKKVIVGLSGGVDSSVSALLLKEQGYDVVGLFMKNWHDESVTISEDCPWLDDSNDAMLIAQKIGIPFQTVDLSKQYYSRIINYMFNEYERGRTPNPDILCNREIKFDIFLEIAINLGDVIDASFDETDLPKVWLELFLHGRLSFRRSHTNDSYKKIS